VKRSKFVIVLLLLVLTNRCGKTTEHYVSKLQKLISPDSIAADMRMFAERPHRAGSKQNRLVGDALIAALRDAGAHVWTAEYNMRLPEPITASLSLTYPSNREISFFEKKLDQDPFTAVAAEQIPFFAYVPNADVEAEVVYANFGDRQDYAYLKNNGINVAGKIALVRTQGICRGMKQQIAEEEGLAGLLLYPDVRDEGVLKAAYPLGPGINPWVVQRGSMLKFYLYPGDPDSKNPDRKEQTIPTVPAMPISSAAAAQIFQSLKGITNPDWVGGMNMTYHSGPGPARVRINIQNVRSPATIRDIFATIGGEDPSEPVLMIGCHYDAWIYGASDPSSGTSTVLEAAKALLQLEKTGWKPKRDIVFTFWDGEEYGMLGSTEWVVSQLPGLRRKIAAVVYTDSVRGQLFDANLTPGLRGTLDEVLDQFRDPATNKTVRQFHREHGMPGFSEDTIPFSNLAGAPVAQLNYGLRYCMYHSIYDNLAWMQRYCDPGYLYTTNLSRMIALYAILLTDDAMLPFHFSEFGEYYKKQFLKLEPQKEFVLLANLADKIGGAGKEIERFDFSKLKIQKRREVNTLLRQAYLSFTDEPGQSNEPFIYRNVTIGPSPQNECAGLEVSGIQRALQTSDAQLLKNQVSRTARAFHGALELLEKAESRLKESD
jgi:N-acetylated-alpha-linked acidic dipeptidase